MVAVDEIELLCTEPCCDFTLGGIGVPTLMASGVTGRELTGVMLPRREDEALAFPPSNLARVAKFQLAADVLDMLSLHAFFPSKASFWAGVNRSGDSTASFSTLATCSAFSFSMVAILDLSFLSRW
jgi:hypothetical protein